MLLPHLHLWNRILTRYQGVDLDGKVPNNSISFSSHLLLQQYLRDIQKTLFSNGNVNQRWNSPPLL